MVEMSVERTAVWDMVVLIHAGVNVRDAATVLRVIDISLIPHEPAAPGAFSNVQISTTLTAGFPLGREIGVNVKVQHSVPTPC